MPHGYHNYLLSYIQWHHMSIITSQITGISIVCSAVYFRCRSNKTSELRITGLYEGNPPVTAEFPHKGPVTWKMFPFDDDFMYSKQAPWQLPHEGKVWGGSCELNVLTYSLFIKSLVPGRPKWNFRLVIQKLISVIDGFGISVKLSSGDCHWTSLLIRLSASVQVMAWCRQATSHYLNQYWPSSMSPYGVTRPQRVNDDIMTWTDFPYHWPSV